MATLIFRFYPLLLLSITSATSLYANFYSARPCSLIHLMQTQPASNQAMRIYADHLEMNGRTVHAEWLRLALAIDDLKLHAPKSTELIKEYEAKQQRMLARHTDGSGKIDEFAQKYFTPLDFVNPYDLDLSHNFVRFDLSKDKPAVFTMGDAKEAREVTLTEAFEISKFLVTQLEYTLVMRQAPYRFRDRATMLVHGQAIDPFRPAEKVSWDDAQAMIKRLNAIELAKSANQKRYRYFLPTEAQWEFAARGGSKGTMFVAQRPTTNKPEQWRAMLDDSNIGIFELLRNWRSRCAREDGVPPYVLLINIQLALIAKSRPVSLSDLLMNLVPVT